MKKVIRFFAEIYYETLMNKTIVFIILLFMGLALWMGEDEVVRIIGIMGMIATAVFMLICLIHGWILYAMDREKWRTIRENADGGFPILRTRPGLILAVFALLMLITTIYALFTGDGRDISRQWMILTVLSVLYLVCFFLGPNRLLRIFFRKDRKR